MQSARYRLAMILLGVFMAAWAVAGEVTVGEAAPDFRLQDQNGEWHTLEQYRGHWVAVYFYPKDDTPGCTKEACAFRDVYEDLSNVSVQVVGISPQSAESHQRFAARYELPFPLLCDRDKTVIRAYGVDGLLGFGVRRVTYLVDQSRQITNRVVADLFVGSHMELVRKVLQEKETS